jgi:meiotically up-regulated gene 157 (Mug157) protein
MILWRGRFIFNSKDDANVYSYYLKQKGIMNEIDEYMVFIYHEISDVDDLVYYAKSKAKEITDFAESLGGSGKIEAIQMTTIYNFSTNGDKNV